MDKCNLFFTRATYNLVRFDYFVVLLALIVLLLFRWEQVDWVRFTAAFLWPDVVGTFPGLYWYHTKTTGERRSLPVCFYVLYNLGHSFAINAVILGLWYAGTDTWEWAMLAIPIHLAGDRAIFGNIYKQVGLSFEAVPHRGFARFLDEYQQSGKW